ncbi:MAG: BtrH N-terminal domain-containing protein [Candidatus Methanofastidiosa archaeon]|nr:BtrH N-terminal domain-containing protein [Candidatus Methanofastidiosa archaeon]
MINILPIKYDTYDCLQNNFIGQTSKYWGFNHLPVLWTGLDFSFIDNQSRTIDGIEINGSNQSDQDILRDFCGLSMQNCNYNNFDDFLEIIEIELTKAIPIAVTIDSYHLKWNKYFQKLYRKHFMLISGIDKIDNEFLCCDGYLTTEICKIDMNYLFEKQEEIKIFKRIEVKQKDIKESSIYLKNVIKKNNPHKSEHIKKFANCLLNCWNVENIGSMSTDMDLSDFLFYLTRVCWNRNNFIKGLQYFREEFQSNVFVHVISDLNDIYNNWNMFKALYIKSIISGQKSFLERAVDLLLKIDEKETKATQEILLICEEKTNA